MVYVNSAIAQKLEEHSANFLKGHFIFNKEYDNQNLQKQFSREAKYSRNVTMEFTKDPVLLEQYYEIRKNAYREVMGLVNYDGQADDHDDKSEILLVKSGNVCVGGARLTIVEAGHKAKLPIETDNFCVKTIYPNIDFSDIKYCEMSRLALLPEFRDGAVMEQISRIMLKFCLDNDIALGFAGNTMLHARRFQRIFKYLGYNFIIRDDLIIRKKFLENVDVVFSAADFTKDQRFSADMAKPEEAQESIFVEQDAEDLILA